MNAARAAVIAFNEKALIPLEQFDWDDYNARLLRYAVYEGYYSNIAYRSVATYSARLKSTSALYKHVRGIYNPVYRLTEAYVSKVYGGGLDFEDLSTGAIPITMADDRLKAAIRQLWLWSNWRTQKQVYVRTGARLGDVAIKVVDEPDRGRVRMEVLHPGKIKDVTTDAVGNVKSVVLEYERTDPDTDREYIYTEMIDQESFRTFRDGAPYAYYANANGQLVSEWDNPYGFVPMVLVQHKDMDLQWGANCFHGQVGKIDEINDAASILNDQIRKAVNTLWYFAGVGKATELSVTADEKDKLPAVYGPKDSQPHAMVANIDLAAAGSNVDRLLAELERDMPELSMHRLREGGNATAPGIRSAYNDAIDRFIEAQGTYDDGLIRAQKMAVSIGGFRGYDGFRGYNLDSFDRGDLEHYIKDRAIIEDTLSKTERLNALQAASAPIWLVLREMDFDQETIDEVMAFKEQETRQAARGFADSIFGSGIDDGEENPGDDSEGETDARPGAESTGTGSRPEAA